MGDTSPKLQFDENDHEPVELRIFPYFSDRVCQFWEHSQIHRLKIPYHHFRCQIHSLIHSLIHRLIIFCSKIKLHRSSFWQRDIPYKSKFQWENSRGAALVRPATAAGRAGCLRPWMPTGSTKVEPLQSFGRLGSRMNFPQNPWVLDDEILWWIGNPMAFPI